MLSFSSMDGMEAIGGRGQLKSKRCWKKSTGAV